MRRDMRFWFRVFLTGLIVDVPLAWSVVAGAISPTVAVPLMIGMGLVLVVAWDGTPRTARLYGFAPAPTGARGRERERQVG